MKERPIGVTVLALGHFALGLTPLLWLLLLFGDSFHWPRRRRQTSRRRTGRIHVRSFHHLRYCWELHTLRCSGLRFVEMQ